MRCLAAAFLLLYLPAVTVGADNPRVEAAVARGLEYLARTQSRQGYWTANGNQYRVAMTALAGNAMLCQGSTTTRGKYAPNIRAAVDFLVSCSRENGLIGYPDDYHYTYGHGFSMVFLSQVYGEEEDLDRRKQLHRILGNAVEFTKNAQTTSGGWGYVSAADGDDFDEGSTCVTQVQALRACRNAGIPVPKEVVDRAIEYIRQCMTPAGGVQYSIRGGGARPAITGAAIACMFNAGETDNPMVDKLLGYCKKHIWPGNAGGTNFFGHWHYAHFYYAQVMYRYPDLWPKYYEYIQSKILGKQIRGSELDGAWTDSNIGPVYATSINLTILQLENGFLPIYQR